MFKYYTAIIFLSVFSMTVLQFCIGESNSLSLERKSLFRWLFSLIAIASICEWLSVFLEGSAESLYFLHVAIKVFELSIAPIIAFLFSWIIEKKYVKNIVLFLFGHFVLECLSGIFGFIWYIDASNCYHHGSFYFIYMIAYIISAIYAMYIILGNMKKYQYHGTQFLFMIAIFLTSGIVLQLLNGDIKVDYLAVSMASMMLYVFTLEMIQQIDELTSLLNRRGYENCIAHMDQKCVVVFFDVDNFKIANDVHGHVFGYQSLKMIGEAIKKNYSKYGKCFRYGGDEFCAILKTHLDDVNTLNHNFFYAIKELREKEKRLPGVTVGYAYYDPDNQNIQDVVSEADAMMYKYKKMRKSKKSTT